jgi:hypothetical protein
MSDASSFAKVFFADLFDTVKLIENESNELFSSSCIRIINCCSLFYLSQNSSIKFTTVNETTSRHVHCHLHSSCIIRSRLWLIFDFCTEASHSRIWCCCPKRRTAYFPPLTLLRGFWAGTLQILHAWKRCSSLAEWTDEKEVSYDDET